MAEDEARKNKEAIKRKERGDIPP